MLPCLNGLAQIGIQYKFLCETSVVLNYKYAVYFKLPTLVHLHGSPYSVLPEWWRKRSNTDIHLIQKEPYITGEQKHVFALEEMLVYWAKYWCSWSQLCTERISGRFSVRGLS